MLPIISRITESTEEVEQEETAVSELRTELWLKERELTDIRLEALGSAHQLEQLRDAMNNMQVWTSPPNRLDVTIDEHNLRFPFHFLPILVHSGEPEGGERPFKNRKQPPRLWAQFVHVPAFRPVLPPGAIVEAAHEYVPHQVVQPQPERLQRSR